MDEQEQLQRLDRNQVALARTENATPVLSIGRKERGAAEENFRATATRLSLALEAGNIGVWEWDFQTNSLIWDARMYRMYGVPDGTPITSELWQNTVHPDDLELASGIFSKTIQQGLHEKYRFRILHPTRGVRFIEAAQALVLDKDGNPVACVGNDQDVTEWYEMRGELLARQSELEALSATDPLTGIGNRRKLDEGLALEISRVERYGGTLSLLIADLDHFKSVNDKLGHDAGDSALRSVAHLMASMVRGCDLLARFGGDEFCILLPGIGERGAVSLARRVQHELEQIVIAPLQWPLTASFGVAQIRSGETAKSLLRRADLNLLQAKAKGRNRVVSAALDVDMRRAPQPAKGLAARKPEPARCVHCYQLLAAEGDFIQDARSANDHWCFESLLAHQPASPPPYN